MVYDISQRVSIRWLPDPPSEPTDTVVLNVGDYFVDLRILKSNNSIEWAMAGEKQILSTDPLRCRWIKTIDSLGPSEPDEGEFVKLPNGNDLETGEMPCAERGGAITKYEEEWSTFPVVSSPPSALPRLKVWILQSTGDGKCFIGKIGNTYIALNEGKSGFGARREEYNLQTGWTSKYEIGDLKGVPSFMSDEENNIKDQQTGNWAWSVGKKLKFGDKDMEFVVLASEDL